MVRIANIVRTPQDGRPHTARTVETCVPQALEKSGAGDIPLTNHQTESTLLSIMKRKGFEEDGNSREIYEEALGLAEDTIINAGRETPIDYRGVYRIVDEIIREIVAGNDNLAIRACLPNPSFDPLYTNQVNTTIISIVVGVDRKLNILKLRELGISAFLHDIGIAKIADMVRHSDKLSAEETRTVQMHPLWGLMTLMKISDVSEAALMVVYQEHERLNGSGYPRGIAGPEKLCEFTTIVSASDVFEALTHQRPHRAALSAYDALKQMLSEGQVAKFDPDVMKSLISRVGLFPVGSWVRLSNDNVAKVVGINQGRPLKPRVRVMFDRGGWKLDSAKTIDLALDPSIQIVKTISEGEINQIIS